MWFFLSFKVIFMIIFKITQKSYLNYKIRTLFAPPVLVGANRAQIRKLSTTILITPKNLYYIFFSQIITAEISIGTLDILFSIYVLDCIRFT